MKDVPGFRLSRTLRKVLFHQKSGKSTGVGDGKQDPHYKRKWPTHLLLFRSGECDREFELIFLL